jgi:thioredoxin 1
MKYSITKIAVVIVAALFIMFVSACQQHYQPKLTSKDGVNLKAQTLAEGLLAAKTAHKPLFVFLHATWCPTCKRMEHEVLVQKQLGDYFNKNLINVAIDYDSDEGHHLNKVYPINATPTLYFFNESGQLVSKLEGFKSADELLAAATGLR